MYYIEFSLCMSYWNRRLNSLFTDLHIIVGSSSIGLAIKGKISMLLVLLRKQVRKLTIYDTEKRKMRQSKKGGGSMLV